MPANDRRVSGEIALASYYVGMLMADQDASVVEKLNQRLAGAGAR
jgi:hypothetical protein